MSDARMTIALIVTSRPSWSARTSRSGSTGSRDSGRKRTSYRRNNDGGNRSRRSISSGLASGFFSSSLVRIIWSRWLMSTSWMSLVALSSSPVGGGVSLSIACENSSAYRRALFWMSRTKSGPPGVSSTSSSAMSKRTSSRRRTASTFSTYVASPSRSSLVSGRLR